MFDYDINNDEEEDSARARAEAEMWADFDRYMLTGELSEWYGGSTQEEVEVVVEYNPAFQYRESYTFQPIKESARDMLKNAEENIRDQKAKIRQSIRELNRLIERRESKMMSSKRYRGLTTAINRLEADIQFQRDLLAKEENNLPTLQIRAIEEATKRFVIVTAILTVLISIIVIAV